MPPLVCGWSPNLHRGVWRRLMSARCGSSEVCVDRRHAFFMEMDIGPPCAGRMELIADPVLPRPPSFSTASNDSGLSNGYAQRPERATRAVVPQLEREVRGRTRSTSARRKHNARSRSPAERLRRQDRRGRSDGERGAVRSRHSDRDSGLERLGGDEDAPRRCRRPRRRRR